ncbi:MAG: GlsB/YeaQ/YmgE family stress response membrane protein [bacterium]|nr:GlsB/YeaQ/YmgE family stress response membrane protein [bacterium]
MVKRTTVMAGLIALCVLGAAAKAGAETASSGLGVYATQSKNDATNVDVGEALEGLGSGDRLRVESSELGRVEGYFGGIQGSSLVLKDSRGTTNVSFSSMDGVWLGHTAKRNGAIALGIAGAVLGASLANRTGGMSDGNVIAGFAAGALIGSVVGLALGSMVTRWQELFPGSGATSDAVAANGG